MPLGWEITLKVVWEVVVDWLNSNPGVVNALVAGGTLLLAIATAVMATFTYKQAKASRQMVGQMKEDMYYRFLPVLFPRLVRVEDSIRNTIVVPEEIYCAINKGPLVEWRNRGEGVAIDAKLSFCWVRPGGDEKEAVSGPVYGPTSLGKGDTEPPVQFDMAKRPEGYEAQLKAEYKDVFGRTICTVQKFKVEGDKAYPAGFCLCPSPHGATRKGERS